MFSMNVSSCLVHVEGYIQKQWPIFLLSQLHTCQWLFTCGVHSHVLPQNYMELDTPLSLSQEITRDSTKKNDGIRAIAMNTSWFIWRTGRWLEFFTNSQKLLLHVTTYDMAVCCDTRSPNHCYTALIQNSFFFSFWCMVWIRHTGGELV